ncbi:alpha/beta fold hydrolase [Pseudokineococcus lusitanus]|uniref:Acyl-CoA synthetase (AMP-forming)/AMP-acid ligase II n=1 Tax=Pseudokineococcus lusitanus TaxID=763993 RepID=A0A3N1HST7_9ACTN|nr:alpha/beta fold hydrolase [Pseudokineococcus lusitanus]ROP45585.1 acyl-CoA synthetase (AMP-forming)/AMP-acid ligase II [Pseudokineococcus lusitanus]
MRGAPSPASPSPAAAAAPGAPAVDVAALPGVDPRWSRLVAAPSADGTRRTWHLLDGAGALDGREPAGTVLAVHGNPTWSYLWRDVVRAGVVGDAAGRPWRVLAVDQLGMGLSDRRPRAGGGPWRLADRVADLAALVDVLRAGTDDGFPPVDGPLVALGHDWGGVVVSGWAGEHPDELAALVLTNTAVHAPAGDALPPALQAVTAPGLHALLTSRTDAFVRAAAAQPARRLPDAVRAAYRAPYRSVADRAAVEGFVADIPWRADDVSRPALERVSAGVSALGAADVPALLVWGPRDPVFGERYLRDLRGRLPGADVHRVEDGGHLLPEDVDLGPLLLRWLAARGLGAGGTPVVSGPAPAGVRAPLWAELEARTGDDSPAVVELSADGAAPRVVSWRELGHRVAEVAVGLHEEGVRPGDRVSLLVPPGADLTTCLYACLRLGAVVVVADQGLGVRGLGRAVRGAGPRHVVAVERGLVAAAALGWPGSRTGAGPLGPVGRRLAGTTLTGLAARGRRSALGGVEGGPAAGRPTLATVRLPEPDPSADAAVLFTSGSTGPAKGAVYTHERLAAMRDAVAAAYDVDRRTALVAAFAPFALLGPALGAVSASPAMDVTAPRTLTARALADAVAAVDATVVFASPAALANVVATGGDLDAAGREALAGVRRLLSAGAPVPVALLRDVARLVPGASLHTPYGMTEGLPMTDVRLEELEAAAAPGGVDDGVLVGGPLADVEVALAPLDGEGTPSDRPVRDAGTTGEVLLRAPHTKARYDQLWATEHASRLVDDEGRTWHRSGDVGVLEPDGRLRVRGRTAHLVRTAEGVVTPVGVELAAASVPGVARAAATGVGPAGTQALVVVVETVPPARRAGGAAPDLVDAVRRSVAALPEHPAVAAVLVVPGLPTDVRHDSKVDRTLVGAWAAERLAGRPVPPPWGGGGLPARLGRARRALRGRR